MSHSTDSLGQQRADWLAAHPFDDRLPGWLMPPARDVTPPADLEQIRALAQARSDIDHALNTVRDGSRTGYRQRRAIERRLARELRSWGYDDLAERMEHCRLSGEWGEGEQGGKLKKVVAWSYKCGLVKLCPDEARAEQRRLVRRYKPEIKKWKQARWTRRVHKAVITWPNIPAGELAGFIRRMPREVAKLLKKFPAVQGVLQTIEAPLSARGDWNLHDNVLILVDGLFNWRALREEWWVQTHRLLPWTAAGDFQMDLQQLPRNDDAALDAALRECIKYPVKHVTERANYGTEVHGHRRGPEAARGAGPTRGGDAGGDDTGAAGGAVEGRLGRASDLEPGDGRDPGGVLSPGIDALYLPVDAAGLGKYPGPGGGDGGGVVAVCEPAPGRPSDDRGPDPGGDRTRGPRAARGCRGEGAEPDDAGGLAPAMIDWGPERFAEWWEAHRAYRRTRSHGVLLSMFGAWWGAIGAPRRAELLRQAHMDPVKAPLPWAALQQAEREALRAEIAAGPTTARLLDRVARSRRLLQRQRSKLAALVEREAHGDHLGPVTWRGRVRWDRGAYMVTLMPPRGVVDLIQGDNCPSRGPPQTDKSAAFVSSRPPPGWAVGR